MQHVAKWEYNRQNKQCHNDQNRKVEYAKCTAYLYKQDILVLLLYGTENKYKVSYQGPFSILQVYDNGTVCLRVGAVKDTNNIKELEPFFSASTKKDTIDHGGECSMQSAIPRRSARKHPPRAFYRPCCVDLGYGQDQVSKYNPGQCSMQLHPQTII